MKFLRLIFVFIAAGSIGGIVAFASTPVTGGQPETQNLRWKKSVIQLAVSTSLTEPSTNIKPNSDVIGALTRSLDAWSKAADIEFRVTISNKQNVSPQGSKGDGVSLITIAQSAENLLFFVRDPFSEAARTRIFYNRKGFITEADIVLNPFQQFSTDGTYGTFDLETTFAHEIGHLLGLKHSAVMGSLMFDKFERNTAQRVLDRNGPILSESDVASIRDLYGARDYDDCCGAIAGRLFLQSGRAARQIIVWAEDSETGVIVGQTETSADGSYRIGGLKKGDYSLYWQRNAGSSIESGEIGEASIERNNTSLVTQKISATRSDVSLSHIGTGMQLGDSAVELKAGGEYLIVIGGKNLDVNSVKIEPKSPYLQVRSGTLRVEDFGDDIEAISLVLRVDKETPNGVYSIFARDRDGKLTAMIGAITVRNAPKSFL